MTAPESVGVGPRRALLYIAWGSEHLALAAASARSAAFMDIPAILFTDGDSVEHLEADHPFERVVVIDISERNHLGKLELFAHLPEDFDSFAYLDTDITVIKDLTFGFEMAERHGIAAAPASYYSLDHFKGFAALMHRRGVALRGQIQYNAGLIFFIAGPDVARVLALWRELALHLVATSDFKTTDQPFLSLAMEELGFNPYTLAPTYNYRALAHENAVGDVYAWHSYHSLPHDLNRYERVWPPRSYHGPRRRENPAAKSLPPDDRDGTPIATDGDASVLWCPRLWDWLINDLEVRSLVVVGGDDSDEVAPYFNRRCVATASPADCAPSGVDLLWITEPSGGVDTDSASWIDSGARLAVVVHPTESDRSASVDRLASAGWDIDSELTARARILAGSEPLGGPGSGRTVDVLRQRNP